MLRTFRLGRAMESTAVESSIVPYWAMSPKLELPGAFANSPEESSTLPMDPMNLHIPKGNWALFKAVNEAVRLHMAKNDHSHDYEHILRVCAIGLELYEAELASNRSWAESLDPTTLFFALMVHDVGDSKYLEQGQNPESAVKDLLAQCNVPEPLATKIQMIANEVSYSAEIRNPVPVRDLIEKHKLPKLAIVQDSDRLDSLGTLGFTRCFAYGGANLKRQKQSINVAPQIIWKRFIRYFPLMKTDAGRRMAWKKWPRMVVMWHWYVEETGVESVLANVSS